MDTTKLLEKNKICKVMEGSHAYGTATEDSDVDMRGIFCADPINLLTPFYVVNEIADDSEEDTKFYELSHFISLLIKQNPNIVQTLWVRDEDILETSPAYELLRAERHTFLSSKIAFTTSGYAHAQLKRIKGHNKWINNPQPVDPPEQKEFVSLVQWFDKSRKVLPNSFNINDYAKNHRVVNYGGDIYGLYIEKNHTVFRPDGSLKDNFDGNRHELDFPIAIIKLNRNEWVAAKEYNENYWTWKNKRNPKRAALEEKYGYDTKHAMHLVRLMRMGYEALTEEQINVFREDADELLEIRNGAMTYEEILKYADDMDKTIKTAYEKTGLRKKASVKHAADVIMQAQKLTWSN